MWGFSVSDAMQPKDVAIAPKYERELCTFMQEDDSTANELKKKPTHINLIPNT